MSAQHHDHNHEDPIGQAVSQAVAKALTHPALIQSIMSGVHEQNARSSLHHCEQMRPVHLNEALVKPEPYNDRGDALILLRRRLFFVEQAVNAIVSFSAAADGSVEFTSMLYADHFNDTLSTKFIDFNDPAIADEFNRQIAEFYTPDMAGKSIQVTMLTCPALLAKPGDKINTDPVNAFEQQDPVAQAPEPAPQIAGVGRF